MEEQVVQEKDRFRALSVFIQASALDRVEEAWRIMVVVFW
jgi:hypothetical protein